MKKKLKNAFSLIELSIVILIVGILIAGVTSSSRLVKRMKVITAQNLTQSSPVPSIKDLSVWYETSLEKSFIDSEESDGTPITTWFDNNIQSSFKYDFKQATLANQPKYSEGIINNLPAVRFDGVDDFMMASQVGIYGRGVTVFMVSQRSNFGGGYQSGLTGLSTSAGHWDDCLGGGSFILFADYNSSIATCSNIATYYGTIAHPGNSVPFIYDIVISQTTSNMFINGASASNHSASFSFLFDVLRVGCRYNSSSNNTAFYNGYFSEIIIYSRALNTEERKAVEAYLSKKYAIKVV
jgi:prepilin-type N-terminal cleavage/methylation domain-containing protein